MGRMKTTGRSPVPAPTRAEIEAHVAEVRSRIETRFGPEGREWEVADAFEQRGADMIEFLALPWTVRVAARLRRFSSDVRAEVLTGLATDAFMAPAMPLPWVPARSSVPFTRQLAAQFVDAVLGRRP